MKHLLFVVLLLVVGCQQSLEPEGTVTAGIENSNLVITNNSTSVAYYAVFERDMVAIIEWAAACTPENAITAKEVKQIAITDSSFMPSNEAVIYWWHQGNSKIANTETYKADQIRSIVVKVR